MVEGTITYDSTKGDICMPYGAYVGTGAGAGGGMVAYGLHTGSMFMLIFAILLVAATLFGLVRRSRRTAEHERP